MNTQPSTCDANALAHCATAAVNQAADMHVVDLYEQSRAQMKTMSEDPNGSPQGGWLLVKLIAYEIIH